MVVEKNESLEADTKVKKVDVKTEYTLGRVLGKGAFAKVHIGRNIKDPKMERAVKVVDLKALNTSDIEALDCEIKTMRRVSHHNIVGLHECYLYHDKFIMVLELCKGGELFDRIVAKAYYGEDEARVAFAQMVEAVGHCHAREVVHRDLKPENLLYAAEEGARGGEVLKLADFGLARTLESDHHLSGFGGTPGYVAPEILLNASSYGKECDLWSLGVVLYIMLCGYPPFFDEHGRHSHVFRKIKQGRWAFHDPYWTNVSPEAKDLVLRLLTRDPQKRLPAEEVFEGEAAVEVDVREELALDEVVVGERGPFEVDGELEEVAELARRRRVARRGGADGDLGGDVGIRVRVGRVLPLVFRDALEREGLHLLGAGVQIPVDAVAEAHELEGVGLVLGPR